MLKFGHFFDHGLEKFLGLDGNVISFSNGNLHRTHTFGSGEADFVFDIHPGDVLSIYDLRLYELPTPEGGFSASNEGRFPESFLRVEIESLPLRIPYNSLDAHPKHENIYESQ